MEPRLLAQQLDMIALWSSRARDLVWLLHHGQFLQLRISIDLNQAVIRDILIVPTAR